MRRLAGDGAREQSLTKKDGEQEAGSAADYRIGRKDGVDAVPIVAAAVDYSHVNGRRVDD